MNLHSKKAEIVYYSWLTKKRSDPILNINSFGRCLLILENLFDGQWVGMLKPNTVKSDYYFMFLVLLCFLLKLRDNSYENECIFTMDSASVHSCKDNILLMKRLSLTEWFILPYTPVFTPIKLYFLNMLKQNLKFYQAKSD